MVLIGLVCRQIHQLFAWANLSDELESGEAVALKASHEEDVSAWVGAIAQYLEGIGGAVLFSDLVKGLGLPAVAVLIEVLLGGFLWF